MTIHHRPRWFIRRLVSQLRRVPIFPRLLLVFCTLLIVSTVFITFFNQKQYAQEAETNAVKHLSVFVQNASLELMQEKERLELALLQFTQNDEILEAINQNKLLQPDAQAGDVQANQTIEHNRQKIEHLLRSIKTKVDGIKTLVFVTDNSQYQMESTPKNLNSPFIRNLDDFYKSNIYKQAVKAQGYSSWLDSSQETSALFYENDTDTLGILGCITISYQVYSPDTQQPLGVLVGCIYPNHFTHTLNKYSSQDGGNTFIVGENGLVEGISARLSAPPFLSKNSGIVQRIFSQHKGSLLLESKGKELFVNFCGEPSFPIHIVNLTYRDYALQTVQKIAQLSFVVMFVVILIGAFGFYLAAVSVAYPVNKLIYAMKRVGAGDFSAMYQSKSHDEIGLLCQEFDRMVADMKELIDKVYVSEIREKSLELNEKTAQLNALQMQISPHFLYNTLDMIRWQCMYENGEESSASDMIEKFCTLLRMTIKGDQKKETVQESLLHASTYLEVVNFRHTSKFQLKTDFSFEPSAYLMPCLSLQPIIENSVRHAFSNDDTSQRCICICGELNWQGNIILKISDNGNGMSSEQLAALQLHTEKSTLGKDSIGLQNVNQRCKLCYGENYGIYIESELNVGTVVTLTIPAEPTAQKEENRIVSGIVG